jgi:hypothetical protein
MILNDHSINNEVNYFNSSIYPLKKFNMCLKNKTWALCCYTLLVMFNPFFIIMLPFGFQYLVIIYINFKFNLNYIKHYIHGG